MTEARGTVAVVVSPTASYGGRRAPVEAAMAALRAGVKRMHVLPVSTRDEAIAACRSEAERGAAALVAVGGDGTMHLALQAAAATGVPLGIIPSGSGNDFATQMGLPPVPVDAAQAIAEALAEGRTRSVDLARMTATDGRQWWYGCVLGAGFDALVNERANAMRWPRGGFKYDLATYIEVLRLRPRHYTITLDGQSCEVDAVLVAVGNTAAYGGGMRMCPDADPHDGLLDVVVAGPVSRTTLVRLKPKVYQGTHVQHRLVSTYRARTVGVTGEGITAYIDGERGCPLPVQVTAEPAALNLLA